MATITKKWLKNQGACVEGYDWFIHQHDTDELSVLNRLISEKRYDWANWLIARRMTRQQYLQYAIYAAEQVIELFEKQYPNDKRPRLAIEAARKCITDNSRAARDAARAAGAAARDAAWAAARDAARDAGAAARDAAWAAGAAMLNKIITYGIELLKGGA